MINLKTIGYFLRVFLAICYSEFILDDLVLIAGRKQDPDTLFFQRRLKIEGDTELGLEVKNLIDAIDIEQLPSSFHDLVDFGANFLQNTQEDRKSVV